MVLGLNDGEERGAECAYSTLFVEQRGHELKESDLLDVG